MLGYGGKDTVTVLGALLVPAHRGEEVVFVDALVGIAGQQPPHVRRDTCSVDLRDIAHGKLRVRVARACSVCGHVEPVTAPQGQHDCSLHADKNR